MLSYAYWQNSGRETNLVRALVKLNEWNTCIYCVASSKMIAYGIQIKHRRSLHLLAHNTIYSHYVWCCDATSYSWHFHLYRFIMVESWPTFIGRHIQRDLMQCLIHQTYIHHTRNLHHMRSGTPHWYPLIQPNEANRVLLRLLLESFVWRATSRPAMDRDRW